MIRYSSTATIKASPRRVFDMLVDQHRFGEWTEMADVSFDGAPRVGTRGTFCLARGPIKGTLSVEIVEFEQDRLVISGLTIPLSSGGTSPGSSLSARALASSIRVRSGCGAGVGCWSH